VDGEEQGASVFLNYWMFSVHAPFDAKKALIEEHRARMDPGDVQRLPTYAAMVESMDDAVGTLLDALDRLSIAERTAVVFYSDNGGNMYNEIDGTTPTSNRPLRGGKATMWEGGIRVPAIVSWPGVTRAGTRSAAIIQGTDYYPTTLSLLGLPPTPDHPIDGVNITAALRGEAFERGPMFTCFPHQTKVPDFLPPAHPCIAATGNSSGSFIRARMARTPTNSTTCAMTLARRTTSPPHSLRS
jgi:phosphoglycerol transferase MdoB-like AlkP superfamily enzyme